MSPISSVIHQGNPRSPLTCLTIVLAAFFSSSSRTNAGLPPKPDTVKTALVKAVKFFHENASSHGGYVYWYSSDLTLREAEAIPDPDTIWVQPPGTPAVGLAFLDAYEATKDPACARAALDAARALTLGQLHSGGWYYSIHFGKSNRSEHAYRRDLDGTLKTDPTPAKERSNTGGWDVWKKRDFKKNVSTMDDDVTQAALRLLCRVDRAMDFKDEIIHESTLYGLDALLGVQFPNGAWAASFDRFPDASPDPAKYPVIPASFPDTWSQKWPKDFTGCYVLNDDLTATALETMLLAWQTHGDERYLASAKKAGDFFLLAQMPDPQPAWAQQYDAAMQPSWSRQFEPTALCGRESQRLLWSLLRLTEATGDQKYLSPFPKALAYLKSCLTKNNTLPRFREIKTNQPIFFTRGKGGKGWELTFEEKRLADNYGWFIASELNEIEATYLHVKAGGKIGDLSKRSPDELTAQAEKILAAQDPRGAWTEPGTIRDASGKKTDPKGGIIASLTFEENVRVLVEYLKEKR